MTEAFEEIETLNLDDNEENGTKATSRMRLIIRGVIKKELIRNIDMGNKLFPVKKKISVIYIDFYIVKKSFYDAPAATQNAILMNAKVIHRKEIARIRKAFKTIESNIKEELLSMHVSSIDADIFKKIYLYIIYQWLHEEFYISKKIIARLVDGFCVVYSVIRPMDKRIPKQKDKN